MSGSLDRPEKITNCESSVDKAIEAIADIEKHLLPPKAPVQAIENAVTKAENAVSGVESVLGRSGLPIQNTT